MIAYLDDGNAWAAERLSREPGWVLDAALHHAGNGNVFAAYLGSAGAHEIAELKLGKKTDELYAHAAKLHKQLDRYAYGPPPVRFTDQDIDRARAAGVLIEFERGRPIIVDRPLYRELVKTAIKRTHDELEAKATEAAREKQTARAGGTPADPLTTAKRERDAQLRELADQAHGANLDLGAALMHNLAAVDPGDINVARFFALCRRGAPHGPLPAHVREQSPRSGGNGGVHVTAAPSAAPNVTLTASASVRATPPWSDAQRCSQRSSRSGGSSSRSVN